MPVPLGENDRPYSLRYSDSNTSFTLAPKLASFSKASNLLPASLLHHLFSLSVNITLCALACVRVCCFILLISDFLLYAPRAIVFLDIERSGA